MVKVAPPGFVVAMVASVLWIPWAFAMGALDWDRGSDVVQAVTLAFVYGAQIVTALALGNLAGRMRGRVRFALRIATVAWTLTVVLVIGSRFVLNELSRDSLLVWGTVIDWSRASLQLITWMALALAGWRASRRTSVFA